MSTDKHETNNTAQGTEHKHNTRTTTPQPCVLRVACALWCPVVCVRCPDARAMVIQQRGPVRPSTSLSGRSQTMKVNATVPTDIRSPLIPKRTDDIIIRGQCVLVCPRLVVLGR